MNFVGSKTLRLWAKPRMPIPDESLLGFVIRLTERNGYEAPYMVLQPAGLKATGVIKGSSFIFSKSLDLSGLAEISGVPETELKRMAYPPADTPESLGCENLFFGAAVPQYVIRINYAKVCPECLRESAHCRRAWDLAVVTTCPVHRCMLIDECPKCASRIHWNRSATSVCPSCEFDWRHGDAAAVEQEIKLSRHIHRLCGLPAGEDEQNDLRGTNPLLDLGLGDLISVLFLIAGQCREAYGLPSGGRGAMDTVGKFLAPKTRNSDLHALLTRAFDVFEDWPHRFSQFLDWRRAQGGNRSDYVGAQKDFGGFYRALSYGKFVSENFNFLRDEFGRYLTGRWDGGYVSRLKSLCRDSAGNAKYVSRKDAARALGAEVGWVDRMIEQGWLKSVVRGGRRRRLYLIERESLEDLKRRFEQSLSLRETAGLLAIGEIAVLDLVEQQCLQPLRGAAADGYYFWLFEKEVIDKLLLEIREKVRRDPRAAGDDVLTFRQAHDSTRRLSYKTGRFVKAILGGEIVPAGTAGDKGLSQFTFSKKQISEFVREQVRCGKGESLYLNEAAKLLGMKTEVLYFLRRKGLLQCRKAGEGMWAGFLITKESLEQFAATYVMASEVAREHGIDCGYLIRLLEARGIMPISGRRIDGGKQYIFRRADIKPIKKFEAGAVFFDND